MRLWIKALFSILVSFFYFNANAGYYSHDAQQCNIAIKYYENKYNIPNNLLHSIALIESGRWDKNAKKYYPWPWAVGVEGKPYFFDNKHQAVKFVKDLLRKGKSNIDVGCNQINLHHHGKNFSNVEQAFNPIMNSNYAAKFLKSHFDNTKNWLLAVARYHSHTPHLGELYASKVLSRWKSFLKEAMPINRQSMYQDKPIKPIKPSQSKVNKQKKRERSKEGIIVFSRNKIEINPKQKENQAIIEISERLLNN